MKVSELIAVLKKLPPNLPAHLIGGPEVTGATVVRGRIKGTYFGPEFRPFTGGAIEVVMFTRANERSDGSIVDTIY